MLAQLSNPRFLSNVTNEEQESINNQLFEWLILHYKHRVNNRYKTIINPISHYKDHTRYHSEYLREEYNTKLYNTYFYKFPKNLKLYQGNYPLDLH